MAEPGLGPGPEPGAPALDLVSCSPGQQLEEREREGRQQGKTAQRLQERILTENWKVRGDAEEQGRKKIAQRWRWGERREQGEKVVLEVWKEDSGKAIRFL